MLHRQRPARQPKSFLAGHRTIAGNRVALLVDGAAAFPAMLDAIAQARRSIVLESYIFAADATGERFLGALIERARAGVMVRLLVDGVGVMGVPADFFARLTHAGGRVRIFRAPRFNWSWQRLWVRDHRKLLVVDDRIAFIGGLNISDDYAPASWQGRAWHDMHASVEGPAARELTKVINRTWRWSRRGDVPVPLGEAAPVGDTAVQILESRLTKRYSVRRAYRQAIHRARQSVRITNAYFIPDRGVRRALRNACARGVRVQLLLAGRTDIRAVQFASRALYARLLRWGVEIYEWDDRVLHAKTAVIDGAWCSIGSYNMDRRSLLHNLEANIACVDEALAAALDRQFEADVGRSRRIESNTWHRRTVTQQLLEQLFFKLRYLL